MRYALIAFAKIYSVTVEMKMNDKENNYNNTVHSSSEECPVCSSNYHQEIITILKRYHSSYEETQKVIETCFCPTCGRLLAQKG